MESDEWSEEIEIIESIVGNKVLNLDSDSSEVSIQCCPIIPANYITVYNISNDHNFEQNLRYLSPVLLTCRPSAGYPNTENLEFIAVNCVWLSDEEAKLVVEELKTLWIEEEGVLFKMMSWIQDNLLEFLNIYDEIHIDERAQNYSTNLFGRVSILDKDNRDKLTKEFNNSQHECSTCFCEFDGHEMCLLNCLHIYCKDCIQTLIQVKLDEGRYCKINCSFCDSFVGQDVLQNYLDPAKYKVWKDKFEMQSIEENEIVMFCPRCNSYAVQDDDIGQCQNCHFAFCLNCRQTWHPGKCEDFEVTEPSVQVKSEEESEAAKSRKWHKQAESLTAVLKRGFLTHCPKCKCWVMKEYGCNHMTCSLCRTEFCFFCGRRHFPCCGSSMLSAPNDVSRPESDIQRTHIDNITTRLTLPDNQVENVILGADQLQVTKCVMCRAAIERQGNNNHARCAVCKVQFCFLCRAVLKGTTHFGVGGCAQHGGTVKCGGTVKKI